MRTVEIIAVQGGSPASLAITYELFTAANLVRRSQGRPAAFAIRIAGDGAAALSGWFGDIDLASEHEQAELVVLPGLAFTNEAALEAGLQRPSAIAARERIRRRAAEGAEIASSCSGVFLLAEAGILTGKRATTAWWLAPLFRRLYPQVALEADAMIVTDRGVVTAGAAMAQLDLCLMLIARHADADTADRCARYLLMDRRFSQARYAAISYLAEADERVARAERWARERLHEGIRVDDLAAAASLSPRTFARRLDRALGLSPMKFLNRLRVERAIELLETSKAPFDEVARRIGYAEPSTLRRLLKREGIEGPRDLRARLAAAPADRTRTEPRLKG